MRRLRWIIPAVLLILLTLAWLDRRYVSPRQVGEDDLRGMSKQQLRARYGEPNWIVDRDNWVYYRGMLGGGTGIQFDEHDVVVHYETRGAQ
jgi:hypothetical protein